MKFLLDESVEARIGTALSEQGHDVLRIGIDFPPSIPDTEVLEHSFKEQRILITNDRDFGELIFKHRLRHHGVIYLRFPLDSNANQKKSAITRLLTSYPKSLDQYITLTPRGTRIRK